MHFFQSEGRRKATKPSSNQSRLAGWISRTMRGLSIVSQPAVRHMHLLETLPLGGKRQLMLVSCGYERFLVGGGVESIESILQVQGESSFGAVERNLPRLDL